MKQGIFWIASYPRSGNTWTRAFLAALEDVIAGREPSGSRLAGVSERTFDPADFSEASLRRRLAKQIDYARQRPGLSFVKSHSARIAVGDLPTIAPAATAGAVYLIRDPRDVAISYSKMFKVDLDTVVSGLAKSNWISRASKGLGGFEIIGSWSQNVHSWFQSPDTQVIRYEDLQEAPMRLFGQLAQSVGLQPSLVQVSAAVSAVTFDRMKAAKAASPTVMEGIAFSHGVVGRWQSVLTAAQVRRIEQDHRPLMVQLGYL